MRSALLAIAFATACTPQRDARPPADSTTVSARAGATVAALKARDGAGLAALVHSTKGVRLTPYGYVRTDQDVVLTREQVRSAFTDPARRTWGTADGSGEPLTLTFDQYYRRFVYDVDFAAAPVVRYNQSPAHFGNTPNTMAKAYPGAQWVELHFPAIDPKYAGMDWRSLWLVFERDGDEWRLTGIAHGSWTI